MKNKRNIKQIRNVMDSILSLCLIITIVPVYGMIVYANTLPYMEYEISVVTPEPISSIETTESIEVVYNHLDKTVSADGEDITINNSEGEIITNNEIVIIEPEYRMIIDEKTYDILLRVTEAEVTGETFTYKGEKVTEEEMLLSKVRVAQVYMNRVEDQDSFKRIDSLYESLTEKNASSTFNDGRYYEVEITDLTIKAVNMALLNETPDYTDGALYFSSGTTTCKYGDYLFTDDVGHSFFK